MKKTKSTVFSKATIELIDGEFYITEPAKKSEDMPAMFNLTDELKQWCNMENVTLSIKFDEQVGNEPQISDIFVED